MPRYTLIEEGKYLEISCLTKSHNVWFHSMKTKLPYNINPMNIKSGVIKIENVRTNHTGYYFCFGGVQNEFYWAKSRLIVTGM